MQQELERRTGKAESVFVDMSVSETIYNLIVLASDVPPGKGQEFLQEAARMQKRFKVWIGEGVGRWSMCLSYPSPASCTIPLFSLNHLHNGCVHTPPVYNLPHFHSMHALLPLQTGAGQALLVREG